MRCGHGSHNLKIRVEQEQLISALKIKFADRKPQANQLVTVIQISYLASSTRICKDAAAWRETRPHWLLFRLLG